MGDSDDEFERRGGRRDKFRNERREYRDDRGMGGGGGGRGGGGARDNWEDRGRQDWGNRGGGDRFAREDYGRRRDRGFSPPRNDMSPPAMKRQRRDWDDDGQATSGGGGGYRGGSYHDRGGGGYQGGHHSNNGSHGGGGGNWNNNDNSHGGGGYSRGPEPDYPTQPPMQLFKHFLASQDDNISDDDAIKKFNEYKVEFKKNQINEFFLQHKEEEWFKAKYHPEECDRRKGDQRAAIKRRADIFQRLMQLGYLDNATCDLDKYDNVVRLLDAAVIMMEGGCEYDLKVLDLPADQLQQQMQQESAANRSMNTQESNRSRSISENANDSRSDANKNTGGDDDDGDGELKDDKEEGETTADNVTKKKEEETDTNKDDSKEMAGGDGGEEKAAATGEPTDKPQENGEIETPKEDKAPEKKKKNRQSDYNYESGSESDISDDSLVDSGDKDKKSEKCNKDVDEVKEEGETEAPPRALHQTCSIFLRNLAPTITKQEVEAMCRRYPGFMRVALQDPQPERRFLRRGWVTFDRTVNIKDICWNLNNIRLRDCEMGAIVNRDLKQRVRPVNGLVSHHTCIKTQIKHAAKIVQNFDTKWGLWSEDEEKKDEEKEIQSFGLISYNPVLKNITDYLVEEGNYEEDELLGLPVDDKPKDLNPEVEIERNDEYNKVLDRMILYLRIVHSFDFYSAVEYPNEDEMPHRCGIMHARGPVPPNRLMENDLKDWLNQFEMKLQPFLDLKLRLSEQEAVKLGKKDPEAEVEKFVQSNTQELAKDKWLCPLSGKKFKGPDFVRKHLFNKHGEKVDEVRTEVCYFNNYLLDPKRPQLPEHPSHRSGPVSTPGGGGGNYQRQDSYGPPQGGGGYRGGYNRDGGGYSSRGGYGGDSGGGYNNYRGGYQKNFGFQKNFGYNNRGNSRGGGYSGGYNRGGGGGGGGYSSRPREDYSAQRDRRDSYPPQQRTFKDRGPKAPFGYRDLDAVDDNDTF